MSDVTGEFARISAAFDQPTLTLLSRATAPATVTLLRIAFPHDATAVPVDRLHELLDALLDELHADVRPAVPDDTGRQLCAAWVKGQWLNRTPTDDGQVTYSLTASAREALLLVDNLTRDRATLSEHRISTISTTVRMFNQNVNPSRADRLRIIDEQIAKLRDQRNAITAGADLPPISEDYLLEGYEEILSQAKSLPADFLRVAEAFETMRRSILADFRAEDHTAGDVITRYVQRADELDKTVEGRAFAGAFELLRDPAALADLRSNLSDLLEHPQADLILNDQDRRELRGIVPAIHHGLDEVLAQRIRATKAIKEYVQSHDAARDRELDATLRALDGELTTWLTRTGARTRVPVPLLPDLPALDYLPRRFHDPTRQAPPPPLEVDDPADDTPASLADMLAFGGPSLPALAHMLTAAAESQGGPATLGQLFANLGPDLHRPVEVFGLLHVAENLLPTSGDAPGAEEYRTVRPDGTHRTLWVPTVTVPRPPAPDHAHDPAPTTVLTQEPTL